MNWDKFWGNFFECIIIITVCILIGYLVGKLI